MASPDGTEIVFQHGLCIPDGLTRHLLHDSVYPTGPQVEDSGIDSTARSQFRIQHQKPGCVLCNSEVVSHTASV